MEEIVELCQDGNMVSPLRGSCFPAKFRSVLNLSSQQREFPNQRPHVSQCDRKTHRQRQGSRARRNAQATAPRSVRDSARVDTLNSSAAVVQPCDTVSAADG